MKVGFLQNTDNMTMEQLLKKKADWIKKIEAIRRFQRRFESMNRSNSWMYKKNADFIKAASKYLDELNQIIQIREMKMP